MNARIGWLALIPLTGCQHLFGVEQAADADASIDATVDASLVEIGCADGTREAFDLAQEPAIAGCSGGWETAGIAAVRTPTCAATGDSSANPTGRGCSAADLCAEGWHVCADKQDVYAHLVGKPACLWETADEAARLFFASAQPASFSSCDASGTDDLFGCGSLGNTAPASCDPLARVSGNVCIDLTVGGWDCGTDFMAEAVHVTKAFATGGGALCCKDPRG